eukprot:TRINITY_DN16110_c0_g1_i2.p1 TRINITY_DN16110_c0_g1~~TRINITY_DN16110_c0_g1_i2.p1  ORF type:complete len:276 (-),score=54.40 TRINITY_DN16110_c0_g1_i2:66-893(-)
MNFKLPGIEGTHEICFEEGLKTFAFFTMDFTDKYISSNNLDIYYKCDARTCECDESGKFCKKDTCQQGLIPVSMKGGKAFKCIPQKSCNQKAGPFFLTENLRPGACSAGCPSDEVLTGEVSNILDFNEKGPLILNDLSCSKCDGEKDYRVFEVIQELDFLQFSIDFCIANGAALPKKPAPKPRICKKNAKTMEREKEMKKYELYRAYFGVSDSEGHEGEGHHGEGYEPGEGHHGEGWWDEVSSTQHKVDLVTAVGLSALAMILIAQLLSQKSPNY